MSDANETAAEEQPKKSCLEKVKGWKAKDWFKLAFVIFLISFVIVAIIFNKTTSEIFEAFLNWMQDNPALGAFVYIFIYTATTVLIIPGSLLTLGAGFVYFQLYGGVEWSHFLLYLCILNI